MPEKISQLTTREMAVTWFLMTGMPPQEVASWVGLTEKMVSYYKRRTMRKVGVRNNNEFIKWFLRNRHVFQNEKRLNTIF